MANDSAPSYTQASHNVRTFIPGVVGMLQVKAALVCLPDNPNRVVRARVALAQQLAISHRRVCHSVTILIQMRLMTAVIVCIFERVWIRIVT